MEQRVVFEQVVEGIVRAFGPRLTPEIKARWLALGIPLEGKTLPAYPLTAWAAGLDVLRTAYFKDLRPDDGFYALGRAFIDGYFDTRMGAAVLALMKVLGPARVMRKLTNQFRSANNFAVVNVRELGPTAVELDMNGGGHPHFTRGLLARGLQVAGAKDISVNLLEGTETRYLYEARWT